MREEERDACKWDLTGMAAGREGLKLQGDALEGAGYWQVLGKGVPGMEHVPCVLVPRALLCCFPNSP